MRPDALRSYPHATTTVRESEAGRASIRTDTGCHVHPSCLSCPLEACVFDAPARTAFAPAEMVRSLVAGGMTQAEVARAFGVHPATVSQRLSHGR